MSGQLPDFPPPRGPGSSSSNTGHSQRGVKRPWNHASRQSPETSYGPVPFASAGAGFPPQQNSPIYQSPLMNAYQIPQANYYETMRVDSPISSLDEPQNAPPMSLYSSSEPSTESIDSPSISTRTQTPHRYFNQYSHQPHPHPHPHRPLSQNQQQPLPPPTSAGLPAAPTSQPSIHHEQSHSSTMTPPATAATTATSSSARNHSSASFRNVSACKRCRSRKHRCDQRLPACTSCEKVGEVCVGFDPFLNREVPRSYVYFLENRVAYLEDLLEQHGLPFLSETEFAIDKGCVYDKGTTKKKNKSEGQNVRIKEDNVEGLVSDVGMVSVKGSSDPRYLGSTSGISFAKVVFAAVKTTARRRDSTDRRKSFSSRKSSKAGIAGEGSLRDSVFTLQSKPSLQKAPFPDEQLGRSLAELYFEYSNCQIPILHRDQFNLLLNKVYGQEKYKRTPKEEYLLNMVFATGSAIIFAGSKQKNDESDDEESEDELELSVRHKKAKLSSQQCEPEEYHAAAIVHLEHFLEHSLSSDHPNNLSNAMEQLQAILLLASFSLLRPVAPGLWYIVGSAVRLALDLGLHSEEELEPPSNDSATRSRTPSDSAKGKLQWQRDFRRRLWWCVYAFDRLASSCVGRPFSINDYVITTDFPSLLDDSYITPDGFKETPEGVTAIPSYKIVSHHYFRFRLLQSEILDVLQFQHAQQSRAGREIQLNPAIPSHSRSSYLDSCFSYSAWRTSMEERLRDWKNSAPTQEQAGVRFNSLFLELNYWQALIMLYRNSLQTPSVLAEDTAFFLRDLPSPLSVPLDDPEDHEQLYVKIAEAGLSVLKIYRKLHRLHLVNYTYLATQHLFMAGISFLYALWHSQTVRSYFTIQDVVLTKFAATSVLTDLIEKCPPAEKCRDAFSRMSDATMQMWLSTSSSSETEIPKGPSEEGKMAGHRRRAVSQYATSTPKPQLAPARAMTMHDGFTQPQLLSQPVQRLAGHPKYDLNVGDLFSEEERMSQLHPVHEPTFHDENFLQQLQQMHGHGSYPGTSYDTSHLTQQQYPPSFSSFSFYPRSGNDNPTNDPSGSINFSPVPHQQDQAQQAPYEMNPFMETMDAASVVPPPPTVGTGGPAGLPEQRIMMGEEGEAPSPDEWNTFTGMGGEAGLLNDLWFGNPAPE